MVVLTGEAPVQEQGAVRLLHHAPLRLRDEAFALVGGVAADDVDGDVEHRAVDDDFVLAAQSRLRPGTFLLASSPVVVSGTPAAARTDWVSMTTGDGSSNRQALSHLAAQEFLDPLVKPVLAPQAKSR